MLITVEQIRAARALKGWSQKELGERAGLSQTAITNIEVGKFRPTSHSASAIREAFESDGLEFIQGGVRERPSAVMIVQGSDYAQQIMDYAFATLLQLEDQGRAEDREILLTGVDYNDFDEQLWEPVRAHIARLQEAGISQRILVNSTNLAGDIIGPLAWHRRVGSDVFSASTPTMVFGDCYALMLQDQKEWMIITNRNLANNQRRVFNYMWEDAQPLAA